MAEIIKVRSPEDIDAVRALVWEFFDVMRARYPEMLDMIDAYIAAQNVHGELAAFTDYFLPPKGECLVAVHEGQPVGLVTSQ